MSEPAVHQKPTSLEIVASTIDRSDGANQGYRCRNPAKRINWNGGQLCIDILDNPGATQRRVEMPCCVNYAPPCTGRVFIKHDRLRTPTLWAWVVCSVPEIRVNFSTSNEIGETNLLLFRFSQRNINDSLIMYFRITEISSNYRIFRNNCR